MVFFNKPAGGPDVVGGIWPTTVITKCRNRSGGTFTKGEVVQLALSAGSQEATEIATNDSNSYRPGYSNDTVWNTIISTQNNAVTLPRSGAKTGGLFGVALEDIADNALGDVQFFGLIEECFVVDAASGDGAVPGQPLAASTATNALTCHVGTNTVLVGFYEDAQDATLTNRALKRVWLTQGLGLARIGVTTEIT